MFAALRTTRSGCSMRDGGRVGNDGFLILSPVILEEGDTAPMLEASRLARSGGSRNGGGRAGWSGFLIPSPVTLS